MFIYDVFYPESPKKLRIHRQPCPRRYLIFRQTKLETKLRLFYHSLTSFMVFCHLMGDILYHSKTLNQKEFFFSKAVYLYFRVPSVAQRGKVPRRIWS